MRVLALHGGGSNANIMRFQVQTLRRMLGDRAEWSFLNGGRDWKFNQGQEPGDMMKGLADGQPFKGWYGVKYDDDSDKPYNEKLFDLSVKFTYEEVEVGVDRVMKHMQDEGPFDVLLGFSQGCIVSHLIAAILRQRGEVVPWRISVLFNGMRVRDNRYNELFEKPLSVPAVMVFGRQDEFYDYGRKSQAALYEDPVVLEHDEGHRFPSKQPRAKEIYEEVTVQILRHCGVSS
uniref:Serine hydrolase domain-containing protein n=2 Tax=Alexandrium monilatum TaxID=311494 RepID=A0A7S4RP02_9DINO